MSEKEMVTRPQVTKNENLIDTGYIEKVKHGKT